MSIPDPQSTRDVASVFAAGEIAAGDDDAEPARDAALKAFLELSDEELSERVEALAEAYDAEDGDRLIDLGNQLVSDGKQARRGTLHGEGGDN